MFHPSRLCSLGLLILACLGSPAAGKPRLDAFGDPLPEGALFRIGTSRLRTGAPIAAMTFSRDGKKLITGNRLTGVHVWEVASGKLLQALACNNKDRPGEPSPFALLALAPGGTHMAEVNNAAVCSVREVATGTELFRIDRKHWQNLRLVQFSPDGKILALMGNQDRAVVLYEVATGKLLRTIPGEPIGNYWPFMAFTPDGKTLAVPSPTRMAVLYEVATGKKIGDFGAVRNEDTYGAGTFSPDGKLFAVLGEHFQRLEVWDPEKGVKLASATGNFSGSLHVTFSTDSRHLFGTVFRGDSHMDLRIWDARTGKLAHTLTDYKGVGPWVAVSPDGKHLAVTDSSIVQVWDLATRKPLHDSRGPRGRSLNVRYSPDGKTLVGTCDTAVHGEDQSAFVWDAADGKFRERIDWRGGSWSAGTLSADGRVLAEGRAGEKITVRELPTKRVLLETSYTGHAPAGLELTPDGRSLLAVLVNLAPGGGSGITQLWDTRSGKKLVEVNGAYLAHLDDQGRQLVILRGPHDGLQFECYDTETGRQLPRARLSPVPGWLAVSAPGGRWVAVVPLRDGPVELREPASGQALISLASRGYQFLHLAFSPTGRFLAGATVEGSVLVWDVAGGREVACLKGHRGMVGSVNWSPDGKRLVSGGHDLTALVWDARPWLADEAPLTAGELEARWVDLADGSGYRAHRAFSDLVRSPREVVAFLRKKLEPAARRDLTGRRSLIEDLDSDDFKVRQKAFLELEKMGEMVVPLLEWVLAGKPSLEVQRRVENLLVKLNRSPLPGSFLQQTRALGVLEVLGSEEARALVRQLAGGDPEAWLTHEALAVKQRQGR